MNKNDYFGARRNTSSRLEDYGYSDMAFATGDSQAIASTQSQIETKNDELIVLETACTKYQNDVNATQTALSNAQKWQYEKNGLCKWTDSKSKCSKKRSDYQNNTIDPAIRSLNTHKDNLSVCLTSKGLLVKEIDALTTQLATLLEAQKLEAQSTLTLAGQGQTPESIKIEAEAQAQAITDQAKVNSEMKARKSKSRKLIIVSIIMGAVILTGIYVFYKIKKGKNK